MGFPVLVTEVQSVDLSGKTKFPTILGVAICLLKFSPLPANLLIVLKENKLRCKDLRLVLNLCDF